MRTSPPRPVAALVRAVAASFDRCLRTAGAPIDVERARAQHAGYLEALRSAGLEVEFAPPMDEAPDAVFVEDLAIVLGRRAVATRPGAPSRRAEAASVAAALASRYQVVALPEGSTLEGGDVLRAGSTLFAGVSGRTNRAGVRFLAEKAAEEGLSVVEVEVRSGLHLKSSATLAGERTIVMVAGSLDAGVFEREGFDVLAVEEPAGGNVLALGEVVLVSAAAPRTLETLGRRGLDARPVEIGEFHAGDGALTCLSIRLPAEGSWAT